MGRRFCPEEPLPTNLNRLKTPTRKSLKWFTEVLSKEFKDDERVSTEKGNVIFSDNNGGRPIKWVLHVAKTVRLRGNGHVKISVIGTTESGTLNRETVCVHRSPSVPIGDSLVAWAMVFKSGEHLSSISTLKAAASRALGRVKPHAQSQLEQLWQVYYNGFILNPTEDIEEIWPLWDEDENQDGRDSIYFITRICELDLRLEENFDYMDRHCLLIDMLNWTDYVSTRRYIVARLGAFSGAEALPHLDALKEMNPPDDQLERAIDYAINNIQSRLNDAVDSEG